MVGARGRVVVIANDVVPGQGVPVAAAGLRAFGLAEGLRAHGFEVTLAVARHIVERTWRRRLPPPAPRGTVAIATRDLARYVATTRPRAVVFTNSHAVDGLGRTPGVRYVYDFFAPKMLELSYRSANGFPREELAALRARKLRGLALADAVIVNGAKKVGYVYGWLTQTDRDVRSVPVEVVPMCVPPHLVERPPYRPVRLGVAGYLQPWSPPGPWVQPVLRHVDDGRAQLDLVVAAHWGRIGGEPVPMHPAFGPLLSHPRVEAHTPMRFADFRRFLDEVDVSVDLFEHNLERELAMVTRTVVALASGVPVVHPPFTEVSPYIRDYDAGWLVDPREEAAIDAALEEIVSFPEVLTEKRANARALAVDVLDPKLAVRPLVEILEGWTA